MTRTPSRARAHRFRVGAGPPEVTGSPRSATAETTNEAPFTAKATPGPTHATRAPAKGASAIWDRTAADQRAEFAPTSSSSSTSDGKTLAAAGVKKTLKAERPNAPP
jgi:hypothetical protein